MHLRPHPAEGGRRSELAPWLEKEEEAVSTPVLERKKKPIPPRVSARSRSSEREKKPSPTTIERPAVGRQPGNLGGPAVVAAAPSWPELEARRRRRA